MSDHEARLLNMMGSWSLRVVDRMDEVMATEVGLGGAAAAALITLGEEPGRRIEDLRQALGITHGGTVRLVDRLQDGQLVRRSQGPDARTVSLTLTAKGRRARDRARRARAAVIGQLFARLDSAQRESLAGILEALLDGTVGTIPEVRHMCRACDRAVCQPCPADRPFSEHAG